MSFNNVENREWKQLMPGVRARTFWGDQMMVCHIVLDEGTIVPMHSHPHEQGGTVVSGEVEFTIDGETKILKSGDSYIVKGGIEHAATAITECTLFEIFSPVREEYK